MGRCPNRECPFIRRIQVGYTGPRDAEIVIIGESPGREEEKEGKPFIGKSGSVLMALLKSIGLSRSDVIIANACRCRINKEKDGIKNQNIAMKLCREKLVRVLEATKPKLIITMGAYALKQVLGLQKILENRGRFFKSKEFGCPVFVTVHPAYILRGVSDKFWLKAPSKRTMKENLMFMDFRQVERFMKSGKVPRVHTSKYIAGKAADLKEMSKAKVVAIDFETTGLNLFSPEERVLSLSLSIRPGESKVFFPGPGGKFSARLMSILRNEKITKIVAARPFEERVCRQKLDLEIGGRVHDVLTMAHILDETFYVYSLEAVANIYTPLKGIKALAEGMRGNLADFPKDKLIKYNGVDTDATLRAYLTMRKLYKQSPGLSRYYNRFMQPIQTMFADVFFNGCMVDAKQLGKDQEELQRQADELHSKALRLIPKEIKQEKRHQGKLQLSRHMLIRDYLFKHPAGRNLKPHEDYLTPKTKQPQCSEAHLKHFSKRVKFVVLYLRYVKVNKILSTYMRNLWPVRKEDGRVYPSTQFTATVTGRTTMKEPTIQTVPQRGDLAPFVKRAFVADRGWTLCARDLGQSEVRIMGWLAKDPNILGALKRGIDIHTKTASIVNNIPVSKVDKLMRFRAKAVNFGFLYGMSARSFQMYALNEYGLNLTYKECVEMRNAYFGYPNGYYKILEYHQLQEERVVKHGFVSSPLGRIRRLPDARSFNEARKAEAIRQAVNFPIQSFSSDLALIGMYMFWKKVKETPSLRDRVKPMWFIHDSIFFQARNRTVDRAMKILRTCMGDGASKFVLDNFGVKIGYPIASDGKVGPSWADMKDYEDK